MPNDTKWNALVREWERQNRELHDFETSLAALGASTLRVPTDALAAIDSACADSLVSSSSTSPLSAHFGLRG